MQEILLLFYIVIIRCQKNTSFSNIEIKREFFLKYNNFKKSRNLLINSNSQKINKFITIFSPYDNVSFISSQNNQNGDLFIITNIEDCNSDKRLIYAVNSNGDNYFSDTEKPYKIFKIFNDTSTSYECNYYPEITPLIMKNKESLVSLSHRGGFESFDFELNQLFTVRKTYVFTDNSGIFKNTFIHLKFYNYSNYVLNSYIGKGSNRFYLQKIFFDRSNITKIKPKAINQTVIESALKNISISCFEVEDLISCLYSNLNHFYIITVFEIYNLNQVYNTTLVNNQISTEYIFSKCIYLKDYVGVYIYYLNNSNSPILILKKINIPDSSSFEYKISDYLGPIIINSENEFPLNNNYLYNDIIKLNDNNIIYISTDGNNEIIMIIMLKLLNFYKNALIYYFKIELTLYNMKIYKDMTVFNLKGFLGIGMTHFNYSLDESSTHSSYFLIGISSSVNPIIEENINVFIEENNYSINIQNLSFNIDNNIFGYSLNGIRIISSLNETNLGFYLFSTEKQVKIESNEKISLSDIITFKVVEALCIEKRIYSIIYESILIEANYSYLNSLSDKVEYYPRNSNLETYYQENNLYGRKAFLNINVNYCYKTCKTCSCYGNSLNNYCLTCSDEYPYFYNAANIIDGQLNNINNCLEHCPENYIPNKYNICTLYIETTIPSTISTTFPSAIPTIIITNIPTIIPSTISINITTIPTTIITPSHTDIITTFLNSIISISQTNSITSFSSGIFNIKTNNIRDISSSFVNDGVTHENIVSTFSDINFMNPSTIILEQNADYENNKTNCYSNKNNKIINQICFENFLDIINNIKQICYNHIIINGTENSFIYGYKIDDNTKNYIYEHDLIYIDFSNSLKEIKELYNLDNNTNIYTIIIDIPSKYNSSSTNDLSFMFFLENGTELNITKLTNLKINISFPMINLESLNYNYAAYFSEQGYDIYNINSIFYNDVCSPAYYGGNDITLNDRKLEIYPRNISINKNNCTYSSADLKNKRFSYECQFTELYNSEISYNENNVQESNFIKYFLDLINYKILICYNLLYNFDNYKKNAGIIVCIVDFCLTIPFIIAFLIFGRSIIRINLTKEIKEQKKKRNEIIKKQKLSKIKDNNKEKKATKLKIKLNRKMKKKEININKRLEKEKQNIEENKNSNKNKDKTKYKKKKKENNKINRNIIDNNKNNHFKNHIKNGKEKNNKKSKISNPIKKNRNSIKKIINFDNSKFKNSTNVNILAHKSQINLILPKNIKFIRTSNQNINFKLNKKSYINLKNKKTINFLINSKINIDDFDELSFKEAILLYNRNIFKLFIWKIFDKFEIIDIFINKKIKIILFSKFFLYLLIDLLLNALLYSDEVVSHKSHNNGKLEFILVITITLSSKIILSIIKYFLDKLMEFEEKINLIAENINELILLRILKKFLKEIIIKTILFLLIELCIIFFSYYYLLIFCTIYSQSQISLLKNYIFSIIEDILISLIITIIIIILRKLGLILKNKYLYNTSIYIDFHF